MTTPRFPLGARAIRFLNERKGYRAAAKGTVIGYREYAYNRRGVNGEPRAKFVDDGTTKVRWVPLSQLEPEDFLDDAPKPVPKLLYAESKVIPT